MRLDPNQDRAVQAAFDGYVKPPEWQQIETAPKDEMFIYYQNRIGRRMVGLAYRAKGGGWRDSEGHWNERLNPSHWMPLPAPPRA